ncbi:PH-domain-containing protein [Sparassis crispa]|uniref:PH-domain-containing protein n=1 Tax=Sparassis crispa TaxID=139825 RepID=A0A401H0D8_9APHY|nr:PH-domain-containing protein [Sparassis crispa]GBE87849.1 PH-domain-containing protein [Sparassis crispa]
MSTSRTVPPPSSQEIARKLSIVRSPPKTAIVPIPVSGTESDSDSAFGSDPANAPMSTSLLSSSSQHPPLSSIAERHSASGEESEEDDDDDEGYGEGEGHRDAAGAHTRASLDETVIKTGYLWKKGERRKTWKKRWFVLRSAHLAFYKTEAEYKLLRLLDLSDIHSCTPVVLKKHANTIGLVSPTRTFYLQAESPRNVQEWVRAINDARTSLLSTSTQSSATAPVPIPSSTSGPRTQVAASQLSRSLSQSAYTTHQLTSSESDDNSPSNIGTASAPPQPLSVQSELLSSPSKYPGGVKDPSKVVLAGYLMKCASRRHNWHKRWFILSGEQLVYSRSHMDTKPHRQIPLGQILDALEYDLPHDRHTPSVGVGSPGVASPPQAAMHGDEGERAHAHTFKVVTTKRTLLLCAPSEEEEIKWLSAVRALIARRSGAGVVPGDSVVASASSGKVLASSMHPPIGEHGHGGVGVGAGGGAGGGRRKDSIARRLSVSGGTANVPAEAASER